MFIKNKMLAEIVRLEREVKKLQEDKTKLRHKAFTARAEDTTYLLAEIKGMLSVGVCVGKAKLEKRLYLAEQALAEAKEASNE